MLFQELVERFPHIDAFLYDAPVQRLDTELTTEGIAQYAHFTWSYRYDCQEHRGHCTEQFGNPSETRKRFSWVDIRNEEGHISVQGDRCKQHSSIFREKTFETRRTCVVFKRLGKTVDCIFIDGQPSKHVFSFFLRYDQRTNGTKNKTHDVFRYERPHSLRNSYTNITTRDRSAIPCFRQCTLVGVRACFDCTVARTTQKVGYARRLRSDPSAHAFRVLSLPVIPNFMHDFAACTCSVSKRANPPTFVGDRLSIYHVRLVIYNYC